MIYDKISSVSEDEVFLRVPDILQGSELVAKIESFNFAGSVKLKAANAMLNTLESQGKLKPGSAVVESSSGNLGVALAMTCAERGYPFTCVTDPNVSPQNLRLMQAYGANVIQVEHGGCGGYVEARLAVINGLLEKDPRLVWTDQYSNLNNTLIHYNTTGPSILKNVPDIDYLFLGVGSSGTLMGCSRFFAEHKPQVKIIAVDPRGSVLFGGRASRRFIPGIGGAILPPLFDPEVVADATVVDETDALQMCQQMVSKGWLVGGSTGSVLCGIKQYADKIPAGSKVVMIAPDSGINYLDTIYDCDWKATVTPQMDQ